MSQLTVNEAIATAVEHLRAERLNDAEQIFRQILQVVPGHFDATQLLGVTLHKAGRNREAIQLLRSAAAMNPASWPVRNNLALALLAADELNEAIHAADAALAVNPSAGDALLVRGAVLVERGNLDAAMIAWQQLVELEPARAPAWANLGHTLELLGRLDEALVACERAFAINPENAEVRLNLASVLAKLARFKDAAAHLRKAIELSPSLAAAHVNLATVALALHNPDEAESAARRAIALDPGDPAAYANLSAALVDKGFPADAQRMLDAASLRVRRTTPIVREIADHLRLAAAVLLPVVYESTEEIAQFRRRLIERVEALRAENLLLTIEHEPVPTAFELVYQGRNDREIHESIAKLISAPPITPLAAVSREGKKIRVGFISRYLRGHTIGRLNAGVIAELSRNEFEVIVLKVGAADDELTDFLRTRADRYVTLPPLLSPARNMIAEQQLDVLVFTDLGMDPLTYSLAFSRFAPVQCVTWGHPVTSGIDTIDYFLSAEALEPAGSENQYTEKLVRLQTPAVFYYRPELAAQPRMRADFDLPEDVMLYGCLQMMWKIHPEFDAMLAAILRRDPCGILLLLQGTSPFWTEKLLARLSRTMPEVMTRVRIIHGLKHPDFLALTSLCDVMLDPIHFGGGNTSYEAFAFGVPVITWPSQMLRGRITYALYKLMGIDDCIAATHENYVDLACEIAMNPVRRRGISEKIYAAHPRLFENSAGVWELENFFKRVVAECVH